MLGIERQEAATREIAKVLLGLAVGYALLPFDLIPNWVPVIEHLDDVTVAPLLGALKLIPQWVMDGAERELPRNTKPKSWQP